MTSQPTDREATPGPQASYPRAGGGNRGLVVAGIGFALLLTAVAVWAGLRFAFPPVRYQLDGYRIADRSVRIELQVFRSSGVEVVCTLRATDPSFAELGRRVVQVRFPTPEATWVRLVETVRTGARAHNGEVTGCRPA